MAVKKRVFRGDRLLEVRERRGLLQTEIQDTLGLGPNQVSKYEQGISDPSPNILKELSNYLEVSADYLLGLVDDPKATLAEADLSPREQKMISAHRRRDLKALMRLIAEEDEPEENKQAIIS